MFLLKLTCFGALAAGAGCGRATEPAPAVEAGAAPEPAPRPSPADDPAPPSDPPSSAAAAADFEPLGAPPPGGWRTRVEESGQSFAAYRAARPNRPSPARATLVLQALGPYPGKTVLPGDLPSVELAEQGFISFVFSPTPAQLARFTHAFFGLETRVAPEIELSALAPAPARVHQNHAQYDARALLEAIGPRLPADAYAMIVLVARDLVVSAEQEFAYGYGLHEDRLAVASFAQLDAQYLGHSRSPSFQVRIRERSHKLLAHEIGHTLGMQHCDRHACVMNGVAHLAELDATPLRLCPICLQKLVWLVELDPLARYEALARYYADASLEPERSWVRGRLAASLPGG